ncbi:MAG: phosphonate C-P lyase system protein PhnH [Rhodospirillales bacterium 20-64-7]|nr:MAG: phosphonate C-P lyase system protein PhnH [Rhodospirillales bacterium 20-64-7]
MTDTLTPAFVDPVADSQACFRAVLAAMSRPGSVHTLAAFAAPAPLCGSVASVLLTLVDRETPLWLDPAAAAARPWIAFHTGAAAAALGTATFAVALTLPPLEALHTGADETPEASATVILQVASLTDGPRFTVEGPGLPADFAAIWQRNHERFPLGVDLIVCAGNQVAALPRSIAIGEA